MYTAALRQTAFKEQLAATRAPEAARALSWLVSWFEGERVRWVQPHPLGMVRAAVVLLINTYVLQSPIAL